MLSAQVEALGVELRQTSGYAAPVNVQTGELTRPSDCSDGSDGCGWRVVFLLHRFWFHWSTETKIIQEGSSSFHPFTFSSRGSFHFHSQGSESLGNRQKTQGNLIRFLKRTMVETGESTPRDCSGCRCCTACFRRCKEVENATLKGLGQNRGTWIGMIECLACFLVYL